MPTAATFPDPTHLVLGLITAGMGGIFLWLDRRESSSRALGASLVAMGLVLFLNGFEAFGARRVSLLAQVVSDALVALYPEHRKGEGA